MRKKRKKDWKERRKYSHRTWPHHVVDIFDMHLRRRIIWIVSVLIKHGPKYMKLIEGKRPTIHRISDMRKGRRVFQFLDDGHIARWVIVTHPGEILRPSSYNEMESITWLRDDGFGGRLGGKRGVEQAYRHSEHHRCERTCPPLFVSGHAKTNSLSYFLSFLRSHTLSPHTCTHTHTSGGGRRIGCEICGRRNSRSRNCVCNAAAQCLCSAAHLRSPP